MITSEYVQGSVALHDLLAQEVSRILAGSMGRKAGEFHLARVELPVDGLDPFAWLHAQPFRERIFWSNRSGSSVFAAVGVADEVSAEEAGDLEALNARVAGLRTAHSGTRYFGGLRFDPRCAGDAAWASFGAFRFVLPRFELASTEGRTALACNIVLPIDGDRRSLLLSQIKQLRLPFGMLSGNLPLPDSRWDSPDKQGWIRNIEWALDAFVEGNLGKVVFARKVTFGFGEPLDPIFLLKHLKATTPECFHFCFQFDSGTAFVGASPERLFYRQGREIYSEAVAGTRPRGESAQDDERLREELLLSAKDQLEHAYVLHDIRAALDGLCVSLEADEQPSEMTLARGRHLYAGIRGTLRQEIEDVDVIRALHPTPAVGGHPTQEAQDAIRLREPFDRGWYAGPVGWIGVDSAELAVGIRSGLVQGNTLSLYSGAGIVPGSSPEAEYEEIEHKIGDFIRVLGLDNRRAKH